MTRDEPLNKEALKCQSFTTEPSGTLIYKIVSLVLFTKPKILVINVNG